MQMQGKDLVSLATARSARTLVASGIIIILAQFYGVLPAELELAGVRISQEAVEGSIIWVLAFQILNHIVHWAGDLQGGYIWNGRDRVNGVARWSAGADQLTRVDSAIERLDEFLKERKETPQLEKNYPDQIAEELKTVRNDLAALRPSMVRFISYAGFYFYVWYLALPGAVGAAAILVSLRVCVPGS